MSKDFRARPTQKDRPVPTIFDDVVILSEKVYVPIDDYPGFNFAGQLFGAKGSNIRQLVQSTKSRISILGRGSTKDSIKEDELANSGNPEHAHFKEPLHVVVQVKAPRIAAHRRMANALKELNHYMVPQPDTRNQEPLQHVRGFMNNPEIVALLEEESKT